MNKFKQKQGINSFIKGMERRDGFKKVIFVMALFQRLLAGLESVLGSVKNRVLEYLAAKKRRRVNTHTAFMMIRSAHGRVLRNQREKNIRRIFQNKKIDAISLNIRVIKRTDAAWQIIGRRFNLSLVLKPVKLISGRLAKYKEAAIGEPRTKARLLIRLMSAALMVTARTAKKFVGTDVLKTRTTPPRKPSPKRENRTDGTICRLRLAVFLEKVPVLAASA